MIDIEADVMSRTQTQHKLHRKEKRFVWLTSWMEFFQAVDAFCRYWK